MKKKEYQKPAFYAVKVGQRRVICTSDPDPNQDPEESGGN